MADSPWIALTPPAAQPDEAVVWDVELSLPRGIMLREGRLMILPDPGLTIWLYTPAADMRCQIDGLAALATAITKWIGITCYDWTLKFTRN